MASWADEAGDGTIRGGSADRWIKIGKRERACRTMGHPCIVHRAPCPFGRSTDALTARGMARCGSSSEADNSVFEWLRQAAIVTSNGLPIGPWPFGHLAVEWLA